MVSVRIPLYCLPYAGSSASVYVRWKRRLPSWIEVLPVELPGLGVAYEPPLTPDVVAGGGEDVLAVDAIVGAI